MNLLEKFENVEINADVHISETDRLFCKTHQTAYESARNSLSELAYIWEEIYNSQDEILSAINENPSTYLSGSDGLKIGTEGIHDQIKGNHTTFISNLVSYFNSNYHVSISMPDITESLLPKKPEDRYDSDYKEQLESYQKALSDLSINYSDILRQISAQLNGRSFEEQALHELRGKCHSAAWNRYKKTAEYQLKKTTIQLHYGCRYSAQYGYESRELYDSTKNILRGIAHYETDSFSCIPSSLSNVMKYYRLDSDYFEFSDCKKVASLKLFKNGRVDIRFATEENARQFADKYLGTS